MTAPRASLPVRNVVAAPSEEAAGVVVLRSALILALFAGITRTVVDPDLWGHLRFGGDILARGLPRLDPYSFTSDIPWVNHEWLAEVVMNLAWKAGGTAGLILLKLAAAAIALSFVALILTRDDDLHGIARDLPCYAALIGMWQRVFVVRPQIFSVALFATLLWILRSAERGRAARLWLLPAVFAVWVNLHGGWIVGLSVLAMWAVVEASPFRRFDIDGRVLVGAVIAAALATLVNPYG
ncbi:MAG: hypothetical protein ACRD1V_01755, partial [Vicinamibacterales bacterium]